jgi:hypothetical protein
MKNILRNLIKKDANYEFQMVLNEIKKKEELKAKAYANRSMYVNPGALRSGVKQGAALSFLIITNHCPV